MTLQHQAKLPAIALGLGVLVSPDTFAVLGNFVGSAGGTGLWTLPVIMGIFLVIAFDNRGWQPGSVFSLVIKAAAAVLLSTGVLASSGFVFNEVFVYWFPNFGFAFLLLALVLGIQLAGPEKALEAQVFLTGTALAAVFILIAAGLGIDQTDRIEVSAGAAYFSGTGNLSLALLLWVGFDLARSGPHEEDAGRRSALAAVTTAGVLFFLWAMVSIFHVPLEKMADSGIPHMKVAKAVLGETGRMIMGVAVISGTLSAVNALFAGCGYELRQLAGGRLYSGWLAKPLIAPLGLALAVGLMMAFGMAGSDKLEIWIRAAFLLWLLGYIRPELSFKSCLLAMMLVSGAAAIVFSEEQSMLTLVYMGIILGLGVVPGVIVKKLS